MTTTLPLSPDLQNLRSYSEYLYSGSLGCIGLLERWFRDALATAMVKGSSIDLGALEQSRTCKSDIDKTLKEIQEGEEMLLSDGIDAPTISAAAIKTTCKPASEREEKPSAAKPKKASKNKPFACNPIRRTAGERVPGEIHV